MDDAFLDGETLTGRQALIIFFGFLGLIVLAGVGLILFGDGLQDVFV